MLPGEIIGELRKQGFLQLECIFKNEDIDVIEREIDSLVADKNWLTRCFTKNMSTQSPNAEGQQLEILRPTTLCRDLSKTVAFRLCKEIAEVYFETPCHHLFDHAIIKTAGTKTITDWHQDQAYIGAQPAIKTLIFWIPLQDSDENNGTMIMASGQHHELLAHEPVKPDSTLLSIPKFAPLNPVICRLKRGDVSVHTELTPHFTGPNNSLATRKAWILHFSKTSALEARIMKLSAKARSLMRYNPDKRKGQTR